ncbi:MAG: hypothetical protein KDA84_05365 [Planctomycetaceae bacterium]|nr:hypothetical protein [Planctomycetaceae bacterium]
MKTYAYVGPPEILAQNTNQASGTKILTTEALKSWLGIADRDPQQPRVIATFVIDKEGVLRLANRRTEHVACAGGCSVLSAGEMTFRDDGIMEVVEVTNQSTGYCPEPESWVAVESALNQTGVKSPGQFTSEFLFRRCESCGQINIVKDDWFVCAVCDESLPRHWNFDASP